MEHAMRPTDKGTRTTVTSSKNFDNYVRPDEDWTENDASDASESVQNYDSIHSDGYVTPDEEWTENNESESDQDNEFDVYNEFVSESQLTQEIEKNEGSIHGLNKYIRQSLEKWKKQEIKVALIGNSGAGKSSLINALRKLKPSDDGAAKVGVVEIKESKVRYPYPQNKLVALWDVPGTGTMCFTRDKYLTDMEISQFDVIIIVTATRFLENDMWLAKQMFALGKHVLFVRTKIDMDMMNHERDYPKDFSKPKWLDEIRADIVGNFKFTTWTRNFRKDIYLVSSPKRSSYDFPTLEKRIEELLNFRGRAICTKLNKIVQSDINAERGKLKNEFKLHKTTSVLYGFLPIPFLESGLGNLTVKSIHTCCLKKFCLDETSLDKISVELRMPKELIEKDLKAHIILQQEGETLLESTEQKKWSTFWKFSKYILPVVGSFLSAHKTYKNIQECLENICDVAAEDELRLVGKRLGKLEKELRPIQH